MVELQDLVGEDFGPSFDLDRGGVLAVKHSGLAIPGDQLKCIGSAEDRKKKHSTSLHFMISALKKWPYIMIK